ncbi:hypothetical protein [Mucilaginibacter sp. OK268]|uniref:hypothetical protein n=1 Tax=Mucilaginibacter sp. OK268 TaxID=1881048 RepID=UPI00115F78D9|nr:hypothetical protein [Mucilaginibacter sp. OK268]
MPHIAFAPQSSQNHGLLNLTSNRSHYSPASARFANASAVTQATIFCPLSSEAYLLTEKKMSLLLECYLTELND